MNTSNLVSTGRDKKGFSIIEVLIALAIFSIGILAVASMQVSANMESRTSAEITQATGIASDQMENLMLLPFDHADLTLPRTPTNGLPANTAFNGSLRRPTSTPTD